MRIFGHFLYLVAVGMLLFNMPAHAVHGAQGVLLVLLTAGLWRYGWAAVHVCRAAWYKRVAYPQLKAGATAAYAARALPAHAFFLVTSRKNAPEITRRVYRSIFLAASASAGGATVLASLREADDLHLIRAVFAQMPCDMSGVHLVADHAPDADAHDALARSLRVIEGQAPSWRDIAIIADGTSCVPLDIVAQAAPFFCDRHVGVLTVDATYDVANAPLFRAWTTLCFTLRHIRMCSLGLGQRSPVQTGPLSVFRADLAATPGFIRKSHPHPLYDGRTGGGYRLAKAGKSTWLWLLKNGYRMVYLPDVRTVSLESPPLPGFVDSVMTVMARGSASMISAHDQALALPATQIGVFTWWSLFNERVSIFTTFAGPLAVVMTALFVNVAILPVYLVWVMVTRYLSCAALSLFRGGLFPISQPFLLYFDQIVRAVVKTYVMFCMGRPEAPRTAAGLAKASARSSAIVSTYVRVLTLAWLALGALLIVNLF